MLERKNVVTGVVAIIVALVGAFGYQKLNINPSQVTPEQAQVVQQEKALSDLQVRIGQLEILRQEQTLTRDIMLLQKEIRELGKKVPAPPAPGAVLPVPQE